MKFWKRYYYYYWQCWQLSKKGYMSKKLFYLSNQLAENPNKSFFQKSIPFSTATKRICPSSFNMFDAYTHPWKASIIIYEVNLKFEKVWNRVYFFVSLSHSLNVLALIFILRIINFLSKKITYEYWTIIIPLSYYKHKKIIT